MMSKTLMQNDRKTGHVAGTASQLWAISAGRSRLRQCRVRVAASLAILSHCRGRGASPRIDDSQRAVQVLKIAHRSEAYE
jgi:hypothetical protein